MSQIQLISMTSAWELMQSLSVEIAIITITFVFAFALRSGPFKAFRSCSAKKSVQSISPKACPTDTLFEDSRSGKSGVACQRSANQPVAQTSPQYPYLAHMVESILRAHGADAIGLYQEIRSSSQLKNMIVASPSKHRHLDLFTHLVQCAGRIGKPELVSVIVDDMVRVGVDRSLGFYECAMKMLAAKKCYKEAMRVYERLEADGLVPSPVTLSCLINFAVELGELDKAIYFFDRLSNVSTPSIRACMSILRVHSKRKDWARSVDVIREMQRREIIIDSLILNIVLATGVAACRMEDARKLLEEFANIADVVSYNTVMKGLAQQKDYARAVAHLDEMRERGVRPNAITFNTVMDAAVRNSYVVEAWRVLARMRDAGLQPDKFTCTTLMKCLQEGATSEHLHTIVDLLKSVTAQCDSVLCNTLYRCVIDAVIGLDDHALTTRVVALMREMKVTLPPADTQRLLHLISRGSHANACNPSCQPWRNQGQPSCTVSVC
jgi:pentatricopeptide repeat protein